MKISYNWLGDLVPLTLNPQELADKLTMVGLTVEGIEKHGDDFVIDIDLTSNRPDALCHLGVAREVAVISGTTLKPAGIALQEGEETGEEAASIEILDTDLCPRYAARIIRGVKVGPSPEWLVK